MRKKIYVVLGFFLLILIVGFALFGHSKKDSYENPMEDFDGVLICQFYNGLDSLLKEEKGMKQLFIDNAQYILKVKPVKDIVFDFQTASIDCEVVKVFKNSDSITIGDTIKISYDGFYFWDDSKDMKTGFSNFMKMGNEYLVFINSVLSSEVYDYPVYRIQGYTIVPVFCYEDLENVIIENTIDFNHDNTKYYCYYNDVKDNEFFVMDRELEKLMYDFKYDVLSTIDSDYVIPTK